MEVKIIRGLDDGAEMLGNLHVYDEDEKNFFACDTMELSWKNNETGVSCIPVGTYQCEWGYMNDLKEYHYQILNVPDRTAIFIHEGNFYRNFKGCVGLGRGRADIDHDHETDVLSSRSTLKQFEDLMTQQPFTITIENNFVA